MTSAPESRKRPFFARLILPFLILAIAAGGFVWLRTTRPAIAPVEAPEKAWRVSVQEITPGLHQPHLLLYGAVQAPREAKLSATVTADVEEVLIAEGQLVEQSAPLAILDDRDIELDLRQRKADVAEIQSMIDSELRRHRSDLAALERERNLMALEQKAVARAQDLTRKKVGSESLLDEARLSLERQALSLTAKQLAVDDHDARLAQLKARLARAEALRDRALLDQSRTRIAAPFAGRIAQVPVAPGDRVRIGDPLVEIYAIDDLEIRAQIPFRFLPVVRRALDRGMALEASARVDGYPLTAVLDRLSGEAAKSVGGVDALFRITRGAEQVVPGRLLSLVLVLPPRPRTVQLPFNALYGLNRIYRLDGERIAAVEVERIGERRTAEGEAHVLLSSPELAAGDKIITTQLPNAVSGLKVTVTE